MKRREKKELNKIIRKKNPWIAAVLNIIPGVGYLYLGKRKVFSFLLLLAISITFIDAIINPMQRLLPPLISWFSAIIVTFVFMFDAFVETKNITNPKARLTQKIKKKNPWIAAILNLIPGLGYLYLGKRKIFYLFLLIIVIGSVYQFIYPWPKTPDTPLSWIIMILIIFAFMYDAFREARE